MSDQIDVPDDWDFEFILVQDFVRGEDRVVRTDGSHFSLPGGSVLPYLKEKQIRLKKVEDEPNVLREFTGTVRILKWQNLTGTGGFSGWPLLFSTMRTELAA
jgi:hypothetical protein